MWLFTIKVTNGRNRKKIPSISFISPFSNNSIIPIHITTFFFFCIFNPSKPTLSNLKLPILFSEKSLYDYSRHKQETKKKKKKYLSISFTSPFSNNSMISIHIILFFYSSSSLQILGLLKNSSPPQNISISSTKDFLPFHKNPIDETLKIYKISCNHLFVL